MESGPENEEDDENDEKEVYNIQQCGKFLITQTAPQNVTLKFYCFQYWNFNTNYVKNIKEL